MIRSAILGLAATAAFGLALAPAAQAKTNISLDVGLVLGGGGIYVGGPAYYDDDYGYGGEDCHYVKVKHKKVKNNGKVKVWFTSKLVCY
jgi:hypothetical protein